MESLLLQRERQILDLQKEQELRDESDRNSLANSALNEEEMRLQLMREETLARSSTRSLLAAQAKLTVRQFCLSV